GLVGIVSQDLADLPDRDVDAVVDVEEGALTPDPVGNLVAGDDLAVLFRQQDQDLERNAFHVERPAAPAQLEASEIELEVLSETEGWRGRRSVGRHEESRGTGNSN